MQRAVFERNKMNLFYHKNVPIIKNRKTVPVCMFKTTIRRIGISSVV